MGETVGSKDFIREIINEDINTGKFDGRVMTRFPPEPNGYLHLGHAKSICLNFGVAEEYHGLYNLRFDDTNPVKEDDEFVEGIKRDIQWLGFDWGDRLYFASDYFDQLYEFALQLIRKEKAYVDSLNQEEIRAYRGTPHEPGRNSPHRVRSIEENLNLFKQMQAGEFPDGAHVLRAKIDMAHPNLTMRDPVLYRIRHADHHRTGDRWCVYPMYDFTHCISDSIEGVTHSLCTWEFENNRPLYDWILDELDIYHPQQIEFAPLNLAYTVLSKRLYRPLIEQGLLSGWDDPRMPTFAGLRRRGYTPEAIRAFCGRIGVAKKHNLIDIALLEFTIREDLNKRAPRVMGVLDPLKVVITNYSEDKTENMEAVNNPEDESQGKREVPFTREIHIERNDFMEDPPRKFFRLALGREVRLRYGYYITCTDVIKNDQGRVVELRCTYDPESRGGSTPDGRKVRGTIHWVSAVHALDAEVRLYDRLFNDPEPDTSEDTTLENLLNPQSLQILTGCKLEPSLVDAEPGHIFQFERLGYFCVDTVDTKPGAPIFNRTITLRDTWAKKQKK
ncbi:MAG TPA: glutamine--tRNA ligase/YqeY domain fusion protein [candidate division Zixibacteria bacterium]|nr:glutamine--tRNA ligase/YqeY domain fusion protein [candidate division Zixibacteria bacterium]